MALAVSTDGERIFQFGVVLVKYENTGHHYMSGIYNIGLFVVEFRTGSSGQVLVFFFTHNDNSMFQCNLDEL